MNGPSRLRARLSTHVGTAAVAIVAVGLLGILALRSLGGAGAPAPSPGASDGPAIESAAPTPVATVTAVTSPTPEPAPAFVFDLAGQLQCEGPINASMGMEVEVGETPMDPAGSPDDALLTTLRLGYAWLPAVGFEPPQIDGHWALHRYLVGDQVKAIAVSTDRFPGLSESDGWETVGLRACDPSEFDPADGLTAGGTTLWLDAEGKPVRADYLFSRPGPGHCGWEHVTFLQLGDELYLRDVKGVLADQTSRTFRVVRALPTGAVDTGFHTSALRLYTVPDRQSIYVKSSEGTIERWGRATEQIGCM